MSEDRGGQRPRMVFDGDCAFCRRWVERWRGITGDAVIYEPYQRVAIEFPNILRTDFAAAVHLIEPDGRVSTGAEAVFRALDAAGHRVWLRAYHRLPGVAALAERLYRGVARHRPWFSWLTRVAWGPDLGRPRYAVASWLFLRALGVIYFVAFISLWTQVDGLIGSGGVTPVAPALERAGQALGTERYWVLPTLCWIDAGDGFLQLSCAAGAAVSLLLAIGVLPAPSLILAWVLYLSMATVSQPFLNFQWDGLLLEAGLVAILAAPLTWRHRMGPPTRGQRIAIGLERWLLFRLMLSSGLVKLVSGDKSWRNLTALEHHYETQPIPSWTSWYMDQLPDWFQATSTAIMFAIELVGPVLLLAPRRLRYTGFGILAGLQLLILATGNYGFFNLLTLALCLLLLDDTVWPARWRDNAARGEAARGWPTRMIVVAALIVVLITAGLMFQTLGLGGRWLAPLQRVHTWVSPLRSFNGYGLFAVVTTTRPEIVIEGSDDGRTWLPYEFRWKPGDPRRRPRFATPHMPRLDWQMWFAAMSRYESQPWFTRLLVQLMKGSKPVTGLLRDNPFPDRPPRYIRAVVYDYRFSTLEERRAEQVWWRREPLRLYHPVMVQPGSPPLGSMPKPSE